METDFSKRIKEENLSISEFANEFCEIVKDMYGKHNYKTAIDIVKDMLSDKDTCPECGSKDVRPYRDKLCCYECGNYFSK